MTCQMRKALTVAMAHRLHRYPQAVDFIDAKRFRGWRRLARELHVNLRD
jgi:hypothetical protein